MEVGLGWMMATVHNTRVIYIYIYIYIYINISGGRMCVCSALTNILFLLINLLQYTIFNIWN